MARVGGCGHTPLASLRDVSPATAAKMERPHAALASFVSPTIPFFRKRMRAQRRNSMRLDQLFIPALLVASIPSFTTAAFAGQFDGTYVGKSTMTDAAYSMEGARLACQRQYDVRITISGDRVTGENLDTGGKATGTVKPDGSFAARGGTGAITEASAEGRIEGKVLRGTFSQRSKNTTCTGTLVATRQ